MSIAVESSVRLPDGRRLSYTSYGPPDGRPVLWLHGLPGSRRDWSVGSGPAVLEELGLRLLAPDRPGFGRSTPHPRRTHASFVEDLTHLTDAVDVPSWTVLGYSAGAPYALAAAASSGRATFSVDGVVLVSPTGPRSTPSFRRGLGRTDAVMLALSRIPRVAGLAMRSAIADARERPEEFLRSRRKDFASSLSDLQLLDQPETAERVLTAFVEATAQGPGGCVRDWALWARGWAYPFWTGHPPLHIWHGDDDPLVPLHHAEHLHDLYPTSRLTIWPGEGHLHRDARWREVLTALP